VASKDWGMVACRIGLILGWSVLVLLVGALPSRAVTPYDDVLVQQAAQNLKEEN
jgi:hypothetical protein